MCPTNLILSINRTLVSTVSPKQVLQSCRNVQVCESPVSSVNRPKQVHKAGYEESFHHELEPNAYLKKISCSELDAMCTEC